MVTPGDERWFRGRTAHPQQRLQATELAEPIVTSLRTLVIQREESGTVPAVKVWPVVRSGACRVSCRRSSCHAEVSGMLSMRYENVNSSRNPRWILAPSGFGPQSLLGPFDAKRTRPIEPPEPSSPPDRKTRRRWRLEDVPGRSPLVGSADALVEQVPFRSRLEVRLQLRQKRRPCVRRVAQHRVRRGKP